MRFVQLTGAVILICFGPTASVYAQRDGDSRPDRQQEKSDKSQGRDSKGGGPSHDQKATPQAKQEPRQAPPQPNQVRQPRPPSQQPPQRADQPQPQQAPQQQQARPQRSQRDQPLPPPAPSQQSRPQQPQRAQQPPAQQPPQARVDSRVEPRGDQRSPQNRPSQGRTSPPPQRSQEQARAWQQQRGWVKNGGWQGQTTWQQGRARHWATDHRTWAQRGGYGGYYLPQTSFNLYFGRQHPFRIRTRPVIYLGYPRFAYQGFSFLLVDPYPEYWPEDWYYSDDVYIDYDYDDDGYYLYNQRYPDIRLAVSIAL